VKRRVDPGSISWRIDRENVLLFGGRRALLLQLAHPLVAQGVADHSNFRRDRVGRLLKTIDLSLTIMFGEAELAQRAIEQIKAVHRIVEGSLPDNVGAYTKGTPYRAGDPELLLWVHATLVETALHFYERFVGSVSGAEADRYYAETFWAANAIGIPDSMLPENFVAFRRYWDDMVESDRIFVGETAADLAAEILYPSSLPISRRLLDPLNLITIGTLPERVRQMYELRWNATRALALKALSLTVPRAIRLLPPRLRFVPHALDAERREREPAATG
jgi:uncharacterized protein (DUF2236 family)